MNTAALLEIMVRLDRLKKAVKKEAKEDRTFGQTFLLGCMLAATERLMKLVRLYFHIYLKEKQDGTHKD